MKIVDYERPGGPDHVRQERLLEHVQPLYGQPLAQVTGDTFKSLNLLIMCQHKLHMSPSLLRQRPKDDQNLLFISENTSDILKISNHIRHRIKMLDHRMLQMKIVDYERPGGPDVLRIKEVPKPSVGSYEIMIQVAAAGLNVYDTWRRQGVPFYQCGYRTCFGYECSGTVTAVGSNVLKFKEGDEVCAIVESGGAYAEFVVVPASDVLRIPSGVSLVEAAALPEASQLTFFALSVLTNVTRGKTILIHGTAGGIDFIAIQYAKHIGCEVFAVSGTEEKLQLCKMLGAEVCINYKKEDFCKRVKAETGEGVDIILDASGRDHFQKNLDCLARGGSLVNLGAKIGSRVDIDLSLLMKKDISVIGAEMLSLNFLEMGRIMSDVEAKFWPLIEDGHIKPIIGRTFTFTEAVEAHRAMEEDSIPGKLLLVPQEMISCDIDSSIISRLINHFSVFSCFENVSSPSSLLGRYI